MDDSSEDRDSGSEEALADGTGLGTGAAKSSAALTEKGSDAELAAECSC